MRRAITIIKFIIICIVAYLPYIECAAQVRVGRMKQKKAEKRIIKKQKEQKRSKIESYVFSIKAPVSVKKNEAVDYYFSKSWSKDNKLQYADFQLNRNIYDKLPIAWDTAVVRKIYPDYVSFYKYLAEQISGVYSEDTMYLMDRLEHAFAQNRLEENKIDTTYIKYPFDEMVSIQIDSPAASVIQLIPKVYATENGIYYNIQPHFLKLESWMTIKSPDILEHEQLHFDIFELYARKIRKRLFEIFEQNASKWLSGELPTDLSVYFEDIYTELDKYQLKLDEETGMVTSKNELIGPVNKKWLDKVWIALAQLKDYSLPEGIIIAKPKE